jgi:hypothetical protein
MLYFIRLQSQVKAQVGAPKLQTIWMHENYSNDGLRLLSFFQSWIRCKYHPCNHLNYTGRVIQVSPCHHSTIDRRERDGLGLCWVCAFPRETATPRAAPDENMIRSKVTIPKLLVIKFWDGWLNTPSSLHAYLQESVAVRPPPKLPTFCSRCFVDCGYRRRNPEPEGIDRYPTRRCRSLSGLIFWIEQRVLAFR